MKTDILYICDRKKCNNGKPCTSFDCYHTTDINHALFYKDNPELVDLNTFKKIHYSKDIIAYIEPESRMFSAEWIAKTIKEIEELNNQKGDSK